MPSELKPCPFCGGVNVKAFGPYGWYRQWGISHSCQSFYSGTSEMMQGFPTEEGAIAAWNTRAALSAAEQHAADDGWMPIETAPKGDGRRDGHGILAYGGKVHFDISDHSFPNDETQCVYWSCSEAAWIIGNDEGHREYVRLLDPEGWRPLPAPPTKGDSNVG